MSAHITAEKFERFVRDITPDANPDGFPLSKLFRQQYVLRTGLVYLIDYAMSDYGLTNPQKLRIARDLSNPEVETMAAKYADLFKEKADAAPGSLALFYRLAGDLCAKVTPQPQGDYATATDGNGDVTFDDIEDKGAAA